MTGNKDPDLLAELASLLQSGEIEVVDCSGVLGPGTPIVELPEDGAKSPPKIEIHKISEYDENGPFFAWNWLVLGEHSGTHFDAPHHSVSGKDYADGFTDTLDVERVVAPANVIDCAAACAADPDFLLTADQVKSWEREHGEISPGEWVLMRSDWDKRSEDASEFLNSDGAGPHSPGPSADCIDYLASKGIVGWGTQCVGIDAGQAGAMEPPFPAQNILHGNNLFGLASLANLDRLPPKGAVLIAAPLKIVRGTGSPMRALALVPREV